MSINAKLVNLNRALPLRAKAYCRLRVSAANYPNHALFKPRIFFKPRIVH